VVPAILFIGPIAQSFVNRVVKLINKLIGLDFRRRFTSRGRIKLTN
jgi:hypothetical protein